VLCQLQSDQQAAECLHQQTWEDLDFQNPLFEATSTLIQNETPTHISTSDVSLGTSDTMLREGVMVRTLSADFRHMFSNDLGSEFPDLALDFPLMCDFSRRLDDEKSFTEDQMPYEMEMGHSSGRGISALGESQVDSIAGYLLSMCPDNSDSLGTRFGTSVGSSLRREHSEHDFLKYIQAPIC